MTARKTSKRRSSIRRNTGTKERAAARQKSDVEDALDAGYGRADEDAFPNQMWTLVGPANADYWQVERQLRGPFEYRMPRWRTRAAAEKVLVKLWRANRARRGTEGEHRVGWRSAVGV